jgi:hypothetical protein
VALTRFGFDPQSPEAVETMTSDAAGIYASACHEEAAGYLSHDLGSGVTWWESLYYNYQVGGNWAGNFFRRQVKLLNVFGHRRAREVGAFTLLNGEEWFSDVQGNTVYAYHENKSDFTTYPVDTTGSYDACAITGDGTRLVVSMHSQVDGKLYRRVSYDQAHTWGAAELIGS